MPTLTIKGFKPLRPGRIHLWCPVCGRRYSNCAREDHDPKLAVVAIIHCPKCGEGGWVEGPSGWVDAKLRPVRHPPWVS